MASSFQSSFIPKEPITQEVFKKPKAGVFGILVFSLFVFSLIAAIGMYFYKGIMKNDIENLKTELAMAEESIDKETINEMVDFSRKLGIVRSVINKHKAVSNFFDIMSSTTVSSVQYSEFNYTDSKNSDLMINLSGYASSYAAIALQENILSKNKNLKSINFSDLSLTNNGSISFKLNIYINPEMVIYSP